MNRADRRKAMRETPRIERLSNSTLKRQMARNGITPEDLIKEFNRGEEKGYSEGSMSGIISAYSAFCLVMHRDFGFGGKRLCKVLKACEKEILESLCNREACDRVMNEVGLRLNFFEPLDRVEEV